jgi:SAM-dependent methyltransferase/uncharacterized protein YbaR (Trm112 family)
MEEKPYAGHIMPDWLVDLMACPRCSLGLAIHHRPDDPPASAGALVCPGGHLYAIHRGVPRFVEGDEYLGSFSFEWGLHRRTQFDTAQRQLSEKRFVEVTGLHPGDLRGATVLDAGIGSGRFADVVSAAGARVVGLDLSYAIDVAWDNLSRRGNVACVQGDLLALPFRPASFDAIYSIGVLHHTPDAAEAFRRLAALLKPGGFMAVYVYSRYGVSWRVSDFYRRVTVHLPHRLLHALSYVSVPLYYPRRLPVIGPFLRLLLPLSDDPRWRWRVLSTFDWYSPRYQSKHTYPEVYRWFCSAGFSDIRLMDSQVCASGRLPAARR